MSMEWSTEWIFLLLAALVIAFGFGVLLLNRRRAAARTARPISPAQAPTIAPPERVADRTALETEPTVETTVEPEFEPEPEPEVVAPASLRDRMSKARSTLAGAFASVLGRNGIDAETWDELEEALLRADVGIGVTTGLLDDLRARVAAEKISEPDQLLTMLRASMRSRLETSERELRFDPDLGGPNIWMFVGVNGVGKTTTIGKVAAQQTTQGRTLLLAAGDTFRAAAAEQLQTWAQRAGAEFVRGAEGGDPSSVIFDGVERASARGIDLVLADTAGRLHTKTNLMEELRKVRRVAEKGTGKVTETLLVIDATTGQNGLVQAREFAEVTDVTGVVLTKLDGSAKGGIVFAIETEMGIPVKLVGVGETAADLIAFDPAEFVDALFES
jgi:fused signal recognition particle receptor